MVRSKLVSIAGLSPRAKVLLADSHTPASSINYYAPEIFNSIGITGTKASLLASGVYGLVKIVATALFMIFGVERAGRKKYFFFG